LKSKGVFFVPARDENGKHNLPPFETIVQYSARILSKSNLIGKTILLTYGPTPVRLDRVRMITNKFTGQLGAKLALELFASGANLSVVSSDRSVALPSHINSFRISDYEDYKKTCLRLVEDQKFDYMIFSAAVADYQPERQFDGKISSQQEKLTINLIPTTKVVDLAKELSPSSKLISFKLEYHKSHDELFSFAKS